MTALVLYLKFYDKSVKVGERNFERYTAPMIYFGTYDFKVRNTGEITHKYYFKNAYVEEVKKWKTYVPLLNN